MATAATLTPEQRRWVVQQQGFDPNTYELDDNGFIGPVARPTVAIAPPSVSDNDFPHPKLAPEGKDDFFGTALQTAIHGAPAAYTGGRVAAATMPYARTLMAAPYLPAKIAGYALPIVSGMVAGGAESAAQGAIEEEVAPDYTASLRAKQAANPWATRAGGFASMLASGMNPGIGNALDAYRTAGKYLTKPIHGANLTAKEVANALNVGVGGGVGVGGYAGESLLRGQPLTLEGAGEALLTGQIFNTPNRLGKRWGFTDPNDIPDIHLTRDDLAVDPSQPPPLLPQQGQPLDVNAYLAAGNEIQPGPPITASPESVMLNLFPGQALAERAAGQRLPRTQLLNATPEMAQLNRTGAIPEPSTTKSVPFYKTVKPEVSAEDSARNMQMAWAEQEAATRAEVNKTQQEVMHERTLQAKAEREAAEARARAEEIRVAMLKNQLGGVEVAPKPLETPSGKELYKDYGAMEAENVDTASTSPSVEVVPTTEAMRPKVPEGAIVVGRNPDGSLIISNPKKTAVEQLPQPDQYTIRTDPTVEAEAAQERLSPPKYSETPGQDVQVERPRTPTEIEVDRRRLAAGLTATPTPKFNEKMQGVATQRGQHLVTNMPVVTPGGKRMAGAAIPRSAGNETALAFTDPKRAGTVTAPHEMVGHNFVNDLRNSKLPSDRRLAKSYEDFTANSPEFAAINKERAKLGLESWTPEEFNANDAGAAYLRDRLKLHDETELRTWLNDIKSHFKTKWNTKGVSAEDFQRVLQYKFVNDAPFNPANFTGAVGGAKQFSSDAGDRGRYDAVQARMKELIDSGEYGGEEFGKLWKEAEELKNKNGGMPPEAKFSENKGQEDYTPGTAQSISRYGRMIDAAKSVIAVVNGTKPLAMLHDDYAMFADEAKQNNPKLGIYELIDEGKRKVVFIGKDQMFVDTAVENLRNPNVSPEIAGRIFGYTAKEISDFLARKTPTFDPDTAVPSFRMSESSGQEQRLTPEQERQLRLGKKGEGRTPYPFTEKERARGEKVLDEIGDTELAKGNVRNSESSGQRPDFVLTTQKELERDKPFGLQVSRNGTVESKQLRAKITSLPASEQEMLRASGVDELLKMPAVNVKELREHLDANGPRVKVESYGMEGKVSEAKKEYDKMTHEWAEAQGQQRNSDIQLYANANTEEVARHYLAKIPMADRAKAAEYRKLTQQVNNEPRDTSPRATHYYETISALDTHQPMPEWTTTKSGRNVQRVDVVIPKKLKAGWKKRGTGDYVNESTNEEMYGYGTETNKDLQGELWSPDNLHENLPNTLGWAMIQYKTGPKGEKIAVIAEAQSRWGQERRNDISSKVEDMKQYIGEPLTKVWIKQSVVGRRITEAGYDWNGKVTKELTQYLAENSSTTAPNHPLLRDYNRLILKAAIDQARKEGATHIMVSDAETAMMTEGHDAYGVKSKQSFDTWDDAIKHGMELQGDTARYTPYGNPAVHGKYASLYPVQEDGKWKLLSNPDATEPRAPGMELSQEPGMRLNYDTILPKIAEELTGSKGERVSLGEHKNALVQGRGDLREDLAFPHQDRATARAIVEANPQYEIRELVPLDSKFVDVVTKQKKLRDNLIFRNPDGTPKTDVSGMMYPIERVAQRRATGEPFSLTAKQYSETSGQQKERIVLPVISAEIDKVRTVDPVKGPIASRGLEEFYRLQSRHRGALETDFLANTFKANPFDFTKAEGWKNWVAMDTPENRRVVEYLDRVSDGEKEPFKLNATEQKIADVVRASLKKSLDMREARPTADGIEGLAHGTSADPNYFPHTMSRAASKELAEHPTSAKSNAYYNDFVDYNTSRGGMTLDEAKNAWSTLRAAYSKESHKLAQRFGPIDKSAGIGLPRSMREANLIDRMSRFNRRYARRLAYYDAIESKPEVSDVLFNKKDGIESAEPVKNVLEDIYGVREHNETKRQAIGGIVRAAMMGTLAGVKDFTTNFTLGMQHMDWDQPLKSAYSAIENATENYKKAQDTGVVRYNISGLEQGEGGLSTVMDNLHRTRDIMNALQGRQVLENSARTIAFGQGRFLATEALHSLSNKKLTAQKRKFLDDFLPEWDKYKTTKAPDSVLDEAAARFVESVQGTYDYRGLPSFAMKGTFAPYLSLARWNVEKFNNFMTHVVEPARNGNYTPLLMQTIGLIIGGAAIEAIVEEAQNKKSKVPSMAEIKEAKPEEQWKLAGYKAASYASLSGYAGILADLVKSGIDWKYNNRVQTLNNPLVEGMTTGIEDLGMLGEAIGKNDFEGVLNTVGVFLEDFSQTYRVANAQLNPDKKKANERSDKYRDLKVFNMGQGNNIPDASTERPNPFVSQDTKKFKQTDDIREASGLAATLIQRAIDKSGGDPELLRSELSNLKRNSYQTMPSPDTLPRRFREYLDWLERTQGKAERDAALADYIKQNAVNQAKSSMIP